MVALAAPAVPDPEAEKWEIPASKNKLRFLQILTGQTDLVRLFDAAGIPMVILKGCAAAMYYPDPILRTMDDIGFIVPSERFENARRLMEDNSYAFVYDLGDDRDYCYRRDDILFELHHRYSDPDRDIEALISDGISRTVSRDIYGNCFPTLPDVANGLILLDHVRHHLDGGLGIRQIIDWMMFVHAFLDDETWKMTFAPAVQEAGLERLAITMTKMCRLWLGLPHEITWCGDADDKTALELLETIFDHGNFGRKTRHANHTGESIALR